MEIGKWKLENGNRKMEIGKWKQENGNLDTQIDTHTHTHTWVPFESVQTKNFTLENVPPLQKLGIIF